MTVFQEIISKAKLDIFADDFVDKNKKYRDNLQQLNPMNMIDEELKIGLWKITFTYTTMRHNPKENHKLVIGRYDEKADAVTKFLDYIREFNNKNQHRKLLNVKILKTSYVGDIIIPLN